MSLYEVAPFLLGGMLVHWSPLATVRTPVRVYPKRRAKNVAHLTRMRKKWERRYGHHYAPTILYMANGMLIIHPSLKSKIETAIEHRERY